MEIVTKTTIGFIMPEEYELHKSFVDSNNMRDWERQEFQKVVIYTKTDHHTVEAPKPEEKKRRRK